MALRDDFMDQMKTAMKSGDTARVAAIRLIIARMKEQDIEARAKGETVDDTALQVMMRGMIKSRRESVTLYLQGNRPELAEKEEAEIAVIESFLPQAMDEAATASAVDAAIAESGAVGVKDMGKAMAVLRAKYAATIDMAAAGALVKARLNG
ncbi:GatB/YqeY domain-containing protein [Granulibacter bethesdensis]|uniref:GatB/YqeY domain-containing protein n=1 Tax=Granulibacter bethesdensis TaxID=364410 RepID=UPI00046D3549|nr:GatB/YqeY domain-containing protein [Granulibacter bethesdensis]